MKKIWAGLLPIIMLLGLAGCSGQAEGSKGLVSKTSHSGQAEDSKDFLSETSWIELNDGSQWVFHKDNRFHWYQSKEVTDDNYYAGTYEFHIGQDAMNYLTEDLSEYGVTKEEMQGVIDRTEAYTLDNLVCFSTTNQSFLYNGVEQISDEVVTSYYGFLLRDGKLLDIANMITGSYYSFRKE